MFLMSQILFIHVRVNGELFMGKISLLSELSL